MRPVATGRSGLDVALGAPRARQQLVEPIDGISIGHALEHVLQISLRVDAVELDGVDGLRSGHQCAKADNDSA